ncbi:hypothetical protein BDV95DRAFT_607873 [Massariosphaeria phaeospora]|uniref:DUF6604 domain-containing protein n=1 Tax=Massariosphaeria phaeospora TaxID=100035 RepID=A0A7C8I4M2_9PLEO|nr:hypothetical protein BDV95DRAFT_607873 [Massariosphaeria phaeospora]
MRVAIIAFALVASVAASPFANAEPQAATPIATSSTNGTRATPTRGGHRNPHKEPTPTFKLGCNCAKPVIPGQLTGNEKCLFEFAAAMGCYYGARGGCPSPVLALRLTASECGYEVGKAQDVSANPTENPGSTNASGTDPPRDTPAKKTVRYTVNIRDWVPMAEKIASSESKLVVPRSITASFLRAIRLRTRESNWKKAFGGQDKETETNHKTHGFFTRNVLTKAFELLRPLADTSSARAGDETDGTELPSLASKFSKLSTEEPSEGDEADDEPRLEIPAVVIEYDDSDLEEELLNAIELFIEDVSSVRQSVGGIWEMYKADYVDIVVASLFTNTAIDVIRLAENELESLVKRPRKYPADKFPTWSLPIIFFYEKCKDIFDAETTIEAVIKGTPTLLPQYEGFFLPEGDYALFADFIGLRWFQFWQTKFGVDEMGCNKLDPSVFEKRVHPNLARVVEMCHLLQWNTFVTSKKVTDSFDLFEDEISRGVRYMTEHDEIPVWVTFGTQLYIDIQDILGDALRAPYLTLAALLKQCRGSLDQFLLNRASIPDYGLIRGQEIKKVLDVIKARITMHEAYVQKDLYNVTLANCVTHPYLSTLRKEDHSLLRQHPVMCGLLQYDLYLENHRNGLLFEEFTLGIFPMVYLYAAYRLRWPEAPAWPDMELLILRQDPDRLFYQDPYPASYKKILKCYTMASGMSPRCWTGDRRAKPEEAWSRDRCRHLADPSIITKFLDARFRDKVAYNRQADSVIMRWWKMSTEKATVKRLKRQMNASSSAHDNQILESEKKLARTKLRPDDMLKRLALFLESDSIDLYFDWLNLHHVCVGMFSTIYRNLVKCPVLKFKPEEYKYGQQTHINLTGQILQEAAAYETEYGNSSLMFQAQSAASGIRIATACMRELIGQPATESEHGMLWAGDAALTLTLGPTMHKGPVPYPGVFYVNPGPGHLTDLYRNWTDAQKRKSHSHTRTAEALKNRLDYAETVNENLWGHEQDPEEKEVNKKVKKGKGKGKGNAIW